MDRLLPIDLDSIAADFAKIKQAERDAEMEAEHGRQAQAAARRKRDEAAKSAADSLQGFHLNVSVTGDDDDDDEGASDGEGGGEEEPVLIDEDTETPRAPSASTMQPLVNVTNPHFDQFVRQAQGKDYEAEVLRRRRKKSQYARKGKVFPNACEARDSETAALQEIEEYAWVHPQDAPNEEKTVNVLGALGKFKKRLTKMRAEEPASPTPAELQHQQQQQPDVQEDAELFKVQQKQAKQLAAAVNDKMQQPAEIDWEAAANNMLVQATDEQNAMERKSSGRKLIRAVSLSEKHNQPAPQPAPQHAPHQPRHFNADQSKHHHVLGATAGILNALDVFNHHDPHNLIFPGAGHKHHPHHHAQHPDAMMANSQYNDLASQDSMVSDFDYYTKIHKKGTQVVDIGAADTLQDLVDGSSSEVRGVIVDIALIKDKKDRELMQLIAIEEEEERRRKVVEMNTKHPARVTRIKIRHEKERREQRERILRIRQENEMIIANKLAAHGLIR
jgi:hypothetical protein